MRAGFVMKIEKAEWLEEEVNLMPLCDLCNGPREVAALHPGKLRKPGASTREAWGGGRSVGARGE
jgi:hypothetical protein